MRIAALAALAGASAAAPLFGSYFANWAQYHAPPYSYTADNLAPLAGKLDEINYAFLYFCPPPGTSPMPYWSLPPYGSCSDSTAFHLMSVDPHDGGFLQTIAGYKAQNPGMKLLLSIGGWNFPSAYFSAMAASAETRATFIQSVSSWLSTYGADGVDIDWESPCSSARSDPVEISCTDFQTVADAGGSCPADTVNIVHLFQEMRAALGSKLITVASQAGKTLEQEMAVAQLAPYVDRFHAMTYDYAVSDVPSAGPISPNAPLYNPASAPGAVQMSINYTVQNYLSAGVPASKIMIGIPLYGHTWFNPTLTGSAWQGFGQPSYVQGGCCGPFATTNGGKPGQGSSECGTYMYSEIVAAAPTQTFYDNETCSDIAYFSTVGADGYTTPGTWISYAGPSSASAIAAYALEMGLAGVFTFDSSMDTLSAAGQFTYELSNLIASKLGK